MAAVPTHSQKQLLLLFHLSIMFEYCLNSTAVLCEYLLTLRKTGLFYLQLLHPVTINSIPARNLIPLEDHEKQLNTTEIFSLWSNTGSTLSRFAGQHRYTLVCLDFIHAHLAVTTPFICQQTVVSFVSNRTG